MAVWYKALLTVIWLLLSGTDAFAEDFFLDSPLNRGTLRFEIDNDTVWQEDSNFTNGWSLQYHTARYAGWDESPAPGFIKWVGNHLPVLRDGGAIVRNGHGIGQGMFTPGNLAAEFPPEKDMPYAGTLTYTLSWQSFNRQNARVFQTTAGMLGREALAKEFQTFVHNDLNLGDDPRGWGTQRETEPILNFGYQYLLRLAYLGGYTNTWGGQLTLAPGCFLGNIVTGAELGVTLRFGWNIPEGFSTVPAPPGYGIFQSASLPKPLSASPHSVEVILGGRGTGILYSVLYDGSAITGDDRDVEREILTASALMGLNYHYHNRVSVRLHFQASTDILKADALPQPPSGRERTQADNSYGSLMIDVHL